MEQNRRPRNKPTTMWSVNLPQSRKEYPMGKRQSLQKNGVGGTWVAQLLSLQLLVLAHVMISSFWDPALCWAPRSVGSLLKDSPSPPFPLK